MSRQILDMSNDKLEELFSKTNDNFEEVYQKNSDQDSEIASKRSKSVKITTDDIDKSADSKKIQPNDLSQAVHDMMSGKSPVNPSIPDGSLTTEKYADNSVTDEKLGSGTYHNILKNLCYGDRIIRKATNGASVVDNGDGTFTITSSTIFGQYYLGIRRPVGSKRFLVLIKGRVDDDSVASTRVGLTMYCYSAAGANLQIPSYQFNSLWLKPGDEFFLAAVFTLNADQLENAVRLEPSPVLQNIGGKATFTGYVVLDVSELNDELVENLRNADYSQLADNTNWDNLAAVGYSLLSQKSEESNHSAKSDYAAASDYSNRSQTAQLSELSYYASPTILVNNMYPSITTDIVLGFAMTIKSVENNVISATQSPDYGAVGIRSKPENGHTYLAIMGSDYSTFYLAFMNISGRGWHNFKNNRINVNGKYYTYGYLTYDNTKMKPELYMNTTGISAGTDLNFYWVGMYDITDQDAESIYTNTDLIKTLILDPKLNIYDTLEELLQRSDKYKIHDTPEVTRPINTDNIIGWQVGDTLEISGNIISYTATYNYSGFGIQNDSVLNHTYLLICKGTLPTQMAYMNTAGNGWKSVTMKSISIDDEQYWYAENQYVDGYRPIIYLQSGLVAGTSYATEIIGIWDTTDSVIERNPSFLADLIRGYVDLPKVYNEAQEAYRLLTESSDDTAS